MFINPPISVGDYDIAEIQRASYANGAPAYIARTSMGEVACKLSVHIPERADVLAPGEFFLKNYAENARPVSALLAAGIVAMSDKRPVRSGYVDIPIASIPSMR